VRFHPSVLDAIDGATKSLLSELDLLSHACTDELPHIGPVPSRLFLFPIRLRLIDRPPDLPCPDRPVGRMPLWTSHRSQPRHARTNQGGKVRQERPAGYLKIVASIIPNGMHVEKCRLNDMSDEELYAILAMVWSLTLGDRKH
jgi:hypothetical protein